MNAPDREEIRDRLMKTLHDHNVWWADDTNGPADALLPVVLGIVADHLDAAFHEAATELYRAPRTEVHDWVWQFGDARAAALRDQP